jgi:hypothetical protein
VSESHEIVIDEGPSCVATCVCGWRSHQEWTTHIGAERDGEFHASHPVLTGENEAIQESDR